MSSKANNASSMRTATCGIRAPAPKGDRDAPPANAGWYAAPATTGRDADLQPLSGAGDAPLASQSRYAAAATTACDDNAAKRKKKVMIPALIEDQQHRSNKINYALEALRLTLDKKELRAAFPRRIVKHPFDTQRESEQCVFRPDYICHLVSTMRLSSEVLNNFLQAAGSRQIFSYGTSKYYEGQTFEEVLHLEWPAQTVALNVEKRLLDRIATAYKAISSLMLNTTEGLISLMSSDNSNFASQRASTLIGNELIVTSPKQEDSTWTDELMEQVRSALYSTISEDSDEPLMTSTSVQQPDFDQALSPRSLERSATKSRTDMAQLHPHPTQSIATTPTTHRPPTYCATEPRAESSQRDLRTPSIFHFAQLPSDQQPPEAHDNFLLKCRLRPTPSIATTPMTCRPPIVKQPRQLHDADESSVELQASDRTQAVRPLRDPDKLPATEVSGQLHDIKQPPRPRLLPMPPIATIPTQDWHLTAENKQQSSRSHEVKESTTEPRTADQEQPSQPLRDPDKPSASRPPHLSVLQGPPAGNDSEIVSKQIRDLSDRRGPRNSEPHTEDQPHNRDTANRKAFFGPRCNLKDIRLVRAPRLATRQDSSFAGPSNSQLTDYLAISRPVDTESALSLSNDPQDGMNLLGFTKAVKLLFTGSSSWARSATIFIYLSKTPFAISLKDLARYDPASPRPADQELISQPLSDSEKTSKHQLDHACLAQAENEIPATKNIPGIRLLRGASSADGRPLKLREHSRTSYYRHKGGFLGFTNMADVLNVIKNYLNEESHQAAKFLFTSSCNWARIANTFTYFGKNPRDEEGFLSFTSVTLNVGEKCLNNGPYQAAKPLFTSISNWSRLALIYLDENPIATGPRDLAHYYQSNPQPASQELAIRPFKDPDKTSTFRVPHLPVSQALQAEDGLRICLGLKAITSRSSHEVRGIRTPSAWLGTPDRQHLNAHNGFVLDRLQGLADTRSYDPSLSSSNCHQTPDFPPERQSDYAEEGYLRVNDGILPLLSNTSKILAYLPSQPEVSVPAPPATQQLATKAALQGLRFPSFSHHRYSRASGSYQLEQGPERANGSSMRSSSSLVAGQRPNNHDSLLPAERAHDQDVALLPSTATTRHHRSCNIKISHPLSSEGLTTGDDHVPGRRELTGPCLTKLQVPSASANLHHYPAFGTSNPWDESRPRNSHSLSIPRIARLLYQVHLRASSNAFGRLHDLVDSQALHFWGIKDNLLAEPAGRLVSSSSSDGVAVHVYDYEGLSSRQEYVLTIAIPIDELALVHDCNFTIGYHSFEFGLEIFSLCRNLAPVQRLMEQLPNNVNDLGPLVTPNQLMISSHDCGNLALRGNPHPRSCDATSIIAYSLLVATYRTNHDQSSATLRDSHSLRVFSHLCSYLRRLTAPTRQPSCRPPPPTSTRSMALSRDREALTHQDHDVMSVQPQHDGPKIRHYHTTESPDHSEATIELPRREDAPRRHVKRAAMTNDDCDTAVAASNGEDPTSARSMPTASTPTNFRLLISQESVILSCKREFEALSRDNRRKFLSTSAVDGSTSNYEERYAIECSDGWQVSRPALSPATSAQPWLSGCEDPICRTSNYRVRSTAPNGNCGAMSAQSQREALARTHQPLAPCQLDRTTPSALAQGRQTPFATGLLGLAHYSSASSLPTNQEPAGRPLQDPDKPEADYSTWLSLINSARYGWAIQDNMSTAADTTSALPIAQLLVKSSALQGLRNSSPRIVQRVPNQLHPLTGDNTSFERPCDSADSRALHLLGMEDNLLVLPTVDPGNPLQIQLASTSNNTVVHSCDDNSLATRQEYLSALAMAIDNWALVHERTITIGYHGFEDNPEFFSRFRVFTSSRRLAMNRPRDSLREIATTNRTPASTNIVDDCAPSAGTAELPHDCSTLTCYHVQLDKDPYSTTQPHRKNDVPCQRRTHLMQVAEQCEHDALQSGSEMSSRMHAADGRSVPWSSDSHENSMCCLLANATWQLQHATAENSNLPELERLRESPTAARRNSDRRIQQIEDLETETNRLDAALQATWHQSQLKPPEATLVPRPNYDRARGELTMRYSPLLISDLRHPNNSKARKHKSEPLQIDYSMYNSAERLDPMIANPPDGQRNDGSVISRHVETELAPTPLPRDNLSGIADSYHVQHAFSEFGSRSRHDFALIKGTLKPSVTSQRALEPTDPALISQALQVGSGDLAVSPKPSTSSLVPLSSKGPIVETTILGLERDSDACCDRIEERTPSGNSSQRARNTRDPSGPQSPCLPNLRYVQSDNDVLNHRLLSTKGRARDIQPPSTSRLHDEFPMECSCMPSHVHDTELSRRPPLLKLSPAMVHRPRALSSSQAEDYLTRSDAAITNDCLCPKDRDPLPLTERTPDQDVALSSVATTIQRRQCCNFKIPCPRNSECSMTDNDHLPRRREYIGTCLMESRLPPASANLFHYPALGTSEPLDESKPQNLRMPPNPRVARPSSHQVHLRTGGNASSGRRLVTQQKYVLTLAMSTDELVLVLDCDYTIDDHSSEARNLLLASLSKFVTRLPKVLDALLSTARARDLDLTLRPSTTTQHHRTHKVKILRLRNSEGLSTSDKCMTGRREDNPDTREITTTNCTPASTDSMDNREATNTRPKHPCKSTPVGKDTMGQTIASAGAAEPRYDGDFSLHQWLNLKDLPWERSRNGEASLLPLVTRPSDYGLPSIGITQLFARSGYIMDSSSSQSSSSSSTRRSQSDNGMLSRWKCCAWELQVSQPSLDCQQLKASSEFPLETWLDLSDRRGLRSVNSLGCRHREAEHRIEVVPPASTARHLCNLADCTEAPRSSYIWAHGKLTTDCALGLNRVYRTESSTSLPSCKGHPAGDLWQPRGSDARICKSELGHDPRVSSLLDSQHPSIDKVSDSQRNDRSVTSRHIEAETSIPPCSELSAIACSDRVRHTTSESSSQLHLHLVLNQSGSSTTPMTAWCFFKPTNSNMISRFRGRHYFAKLPEAKSAGSRDTFNVEVLISSTTREPYSSRVDDSLMPRLLKSPTMDPHATIFGTKRDSDTRCTETKEETQNSEHLALSRLPDRSDGVHHHCDTSSRCTHNTRDLLQPTQTAPRVTATTVWKPVPCVM